MNINLWLMYFLLGASYGLLFIGVLELFFEIPYISFYFVLFKLLPGLVCVVIVNLLISNYKLRHKID
ncbi:MAG: hypothetical protein MR902_02945 [Campylobacter sp.]|nr:hypothetical protein [Campylobacter sp.]